MGKLKSMKWFKHETNAYLNLKLQAVINNYGLEGYGYYWSCVELVGEQGKDFRIKSEKNWKILFQKILNIEIKKQEVLLEFFADNGLIDKKALQKQDLFIPKLAERCDEYTDKIRRKSGQGRDIVRLEENRKEENRKEENRKEEIELPIWLNKKKWNEWVKYLTEKKKKKPANSTLELHIKKLSKNIIGHTEMIDKAIDRQWSSVFLPDKQNTNLRISPRFFEEPNTSHEDNERIRLLTNQSKELTKKFSI